MNPGNAPAQVTHAADAARPVRGSPARLTSNGAIGNCSQQRGSNRFGRQGVHVVKDPVCGMTIDEKTAAGKSEYNGQTFYFCAAICKTRFDKDPARYVTRG